MLVYCRQDGSASWSAASSGEGLVNMGKSEQGVGTTPGRRSRELEVAVGSGSYAPLPGSAEVRYALERFFQARCGKRSDSITVRDVDVERVQACWNDKSRLGLELQTLLGSGVGYDAEVGKLARDRAVYHVHGYVQQRRIMGGGGRLGRGEAGGSSQADAVGGSERGAVGSGGGRVVGARGVGGGAVAALRAGEVGSGAAGSKVMDVSGASDAMSAEPSAHAAAKRSRASAAPQRTLERRISMLEEGDRQGCDPASSSARRPGEGMKRPRRWVSGRSGGQLGRVDGSSSGHGAAVGTVERESDGLDGASARGAKGVGHPQAAERRGSVDGDASQARIVGARIDAEAAGQESLRRSARIAARAEEGRGGRGGGRAAVEGRGGGARGRAVARSRGRGMPGEDRLEGEVVLEGGSELDAGAAVEPASVRVSRHGGKGGRGRGSHR